ncbi:MAG: pyruvate carboxylase subunit B, partial [Dehalococcoidia bacterium]|nr:pyruvate carboxylase subunit B [Dehalococcoidia bacterium]
IDVFRIFDALNDERNLRVAMEVAKECGKHVQAVVCYSLTEPKLGGTVFTIDYFVDKALILQDMGADSLCVKDMAGLMSPDDAYDIISSLKDVLDIPVSLHSHATSGMAPMSLLKAVEAGVDMIDTCLAPLAMRTSHTAIETMMASLRRTPRDIGMDLDSVLALDDKLEAIVPKYRDYLAQTRMSVIDTAVLRHQIPGGMYSNMVSQLKEAGSLDRLAEVCEELPKVRKDLGYPPLVTPTSQIVGTQAVSNVLFGRYKTISEQVRAYAYGLYGTPPAPMDTEVQELALKGYERGDKPITGRPADFIEPEMDAATAEVGDLAADIGDVLQYVLYPTSGSRFLRWKYGLEAPPPETKGKTLEDINREDALLEQVRSGRVAAVPEKEAVEALAESPVEEDEVAAAPVEGTPLLAPMPGTVIRYLVAVGDEVEAGDGICVLEAMKMENVLPAPDDGKVVALSCQPGEKVRLDQTLAVIG